MCWGYNSSGQLGIGVSGQDQVSPQQVSGGLSQTVLISAGGEHTCRVQHDGALYCWGRNAEGQLGNGTNLQSSMPHVVPDVVVFSDSVFGHGFEGPGP